ncbi:hypothetical protein JP75_20240 [Devosia riboflavina]|uniref:C4-dicarboxylate ABC transporter substrate-binding protein n=2 Tax=Devosia riboflavina TaxID=46914 RepID=A0A087LY66_9HYPH|nr:hypothetical protein JP75_20240 [Devosia riboflavina]
MGVNSALRPVLIATALMLGLVPAFAVDPVKLDMSIYLGINAPQAVTLAAFVKEVEEQTNGGVQITIRPVGELPYSPQEYHRVVGDGSIAMADTSWLTADLRAAGLMTLPLLVQNFDELRVAMDVVKPELTAELDRFGAEVLFWYAIPPVKFWGTGTPPTGLESFAGKRVRSLTNEGSELLSAIGATPVVLSTPEVITALQYGTVNAVMTAGVGVFNGGWDKSFEWGYTLSVAPTPSYVIINKAVMAGLSPENQAALREVAEKYHELMLTTIAGQEGESLDRLKAAGLTLVPPTDADVERLRGLAQPIWEQWAESIGEDAPTMLASVREALGR